MKTKNFFEKEEDPPGSQLLTKKKKSLLAEPEKSSGSFFVLTKPYIEIVSEISSCYKLWKEFSPQKVLFDTWEFRLAFYQAYQYKPYFMVLKNGFENLALLPLWFDQSRKLYTWFGSDWQEEVSFFAKDHQAMKILLKEAPRPLYLNAIKKESVQALRREFEFEKDEPKYVLDLENFKSHEDYLMTLKKNDRRDLRKDRNRILRQNPEIIFDHFDDFEELVRLAKERFRQKGKITDWEDPRRVEAFREVIKLSGKSYQARMISVKIGKKIAGVDLIAIFNNTYYTLKCGYNVKDFKGIGNFVNLIEIDDAIKLGLQRIDFLQNNYQWKSRWFKPIPLFQYQKN